ncbi:MAG: DUF998 domain-containing protein [Holophagales bacterium]|nr:DUF998 domain-containing protein [Holophagales bacterium]
MRRLSFVAIAGFSLFLFVLFLMHFVHPEIGFTNRFLSEYALGEHGWLLNVAFTGNLLGSVAFLAAIYQAYPPPHRSIAALACYGVATLAILTNFFPTDPNGVAVSFSGHIHNLGGFLGGLAALVFFVIHSQRLHSFGLLQGRYRALVWLAILAPILFIVVLVAAARESEMIGIIQRVYVLAVMLWLILAADGIGSGALLVKGSRR